MADTADLPVAPEDQYPLGVAWEPVSERRLVNGDRLRMRVERHGRRVLIDIGCDHPSRPDEARWHYQIAATPTDLLWLIADLSTAALLVERETVGAFRRLLSRADAAPVPDAPAAAPEPVPEAVEPTPAPPAADEPVAAVAPAPVPAAPRREWVDPESEKAA